MRLRAPKVPGLAPLFRVILAKLFSGTLEGLDTEMRRTTDPAAS